MDLQGFSTDSFEQFIRALALKVLGPGVTVFGNGPDGGREATFQGKLNFPYPPSDLWEGYGVVQAKFKEKTESTKKDQAWAVKQLNDELALWKSGKRNPKPDYFIFCTNVELSSAAKGGRAAALKIFEEYKAPLKLKGYAIWDANQLKGYVDGYEEIRKRFSCFFTPGDLLSEFAKALVRVPDPDAILTSYLGREILADEDARLSQAGDRSEDRIRLASVFMDLPVALTPSAEPPVEEKKLPPASLHDLLRSASYKLDPLALYEQRELSDQSKTGLERLYARFLFIGGPGSGKSTIGQFLAQIHRAALLDRRPPHRVEEKVRAVVNDIRHRCKEEVAHWPRTPRYPFRVELNAFAKALAADEKGVRTLSEYLRLNLSGDFELSHEDLRDWLRAFPWLLILDGLDEVPSSSNRREVVAAIQNFLNEARDVEADLMIVSSSRPDGYAGEFDGDEVAQRYLLPLSKSRALACAQRYVNSKAATKGDQRAAEAMATITSAIEKPLVARLMRSPLQVTFMVTVVAASGKPSESRWQLFNDYYRTIYERELHKAVRPFDKVLNERRQDIDALHHRVGFILQCRAESSGGTQADLSMVEFKQLVTECLEENGLVDEELANQREMILGAASLRLVFLTSRSPGTLSFDIRSLQEYMAAACLTNADSSDVIIRLDIIAHSAYWRNTLLFAVGRFFVEPQMRAHRDKIRVLCEDLNRKEDIRAAAKLGSRLALEILESGTIGNVPLFNRSLADCALKLLANPPSESDDVLERLSEVYDSSMSAEFQNAIALWLGQKELTFTLSAWVLLLSLEKRAVPWAVEIAAEKWPSSIRSSSVVLSTWLSHLLRRDKRGVSLNRVDLHRLQTAIPNISPKEFRGNFPTRDNAFDLREPTWLVSLFHYFSSRSIDRGIQVSLVVGKGASRLRVHFNSITNDMQHVWAGLKSLEGEAVRHADWQVLIRIADFYLGPTDETLACVLESIADSSEPEQWIRHLPWPIVCSLGNDLAATEIQLRAQKFREGYYGEVASWIDQEKAWLETGITLEELTSTLFHFSRPTAAAVNTISIVGTKEERDEQIIVAFYNALRETDNPYSKNLIGRIFTLLVNSARKWELFDPVILKSDLLSSREAWWSWMVFANSADLKRRDESWIAFYDYYGRMKELRFFPHNPWPGELPLDFLLNAFVKDPSRVGLLRLVGFWCAAGRNSSIDIPTDQVEQIKEPRFRLAAMLVKLSRLGLTVDEAQQIADFIPTIAVRESEPDYLDILLTAIERHAAEIPSLENLVGKIADIVPIDQWPLRARAEALRNTFLQARSSGFNTQLMTSLSLPMIEP
jgi:hypothetical protein